MTIPSIIGLKALRLAVLKINVDINNYIISSSNSTLFSGIQINICDAIYNRRTCFCHGFRSVFRESIAKNRNQYHLKKIKKTETI